MKITDITSQDAGTYTCIAKNKAGIDESTINVLVAGTFLLFSDNKETQLFSTSLLASRFGNTLMIIYEGDGFEEVRVLRLA